MSPKKKKPKPNMIKFPIRQLFKVIVQGTAPLIILNYTIQWADRTKGQVSGIGKSSAGLQYTKMVTAMILCKITSLITAHHHLFKNKRQRLCFCTVKKCTDISDIDLKNVY
jgi:hypothetical protein